MNNEFLIELQAILNREISKGNINKSIERIQNQINKLKLQVEIDPKSILAIKKQLEQITNQPIKLTNINIDQGQIDKTGKDIGKSISDTVQKEFNNSKINTDKLNADIKTLKNNINNFASKNSGFDVFKTEINGVEVSLDSLIHKLSTVDNTTDLATLRSQVNALKTTFTELSQVNKIQLSIDNGDYATQILSYETALKKLYLSSEEVAEKMKGVSDVYDSLKSNVTSENIIPNDIITKANKLETEMNKLGNTVKQIKLKSSLQADDLQVGQTIIRLNKQILDNSRYTEQAKNKLHEFVSELEKGGVASGRLKQINIEAKKIHANMAAVNKTGKGFFESLGLKINSLGTYLSAATIISNILSSAKNGASCVKELDTALVDLKKTTTMTSNQLEDFYYKSNDVAKQMGVTTTEIINQASSWSRLGFSSAEAATKMAKFSSQFASISPGMNVDDATTSLVSIMKAYDIDVDNVLDGILSKINDIGNKFGTSNFEIAEGLKKSSAAMAAVGGTLEDNIALFTAGQEIVQDASQVGNAIRSIALRIRGYDEETEQLSDDLIDVTGKVADLTKVASNDGHGISLFTDTSQKEYKSLVTYLGEISDIWNELDQKSQNDLLDKLFGKNRAQVGVAIIKNFDAVRNSIETMENSAGSADREMSTITEGIEYKLNRLKETSTGIAQNLFQREDMKSVVDVLNSFMEILDKVTEKIGLFGTIGLGTGLFAGLKNVGKPRMFGFNIV